MPFINSKEESCIPAYIRGIFIWGKKKPQNITKAGLEGCHTDTGCCQACSLHQPYNAFYQPAPDTKLQNHQEHQLLMLNIC